MKKGKDKIAVLGIGFAGGKVVNELSAQLEVDVFAIDTNASDLDQLQIEKVQIGRITTQGLGASGRAEIGRSAAQEDQDVLADLVSGYELVYLVAGMGGGTGTAVAPLIGKLVQAQGKQCIAVLSEPFLYEGKRRFSQACEGLQQMYEIVDLCVVYNNQDLFLNSSFESHTFRQVMKIGQQLMQTVVRGCFALHHSGSSQQTMAQNHACALVGVGYASDESKVNEAIHQAMWDPFIQDYRLSQATQAYVHVSGPVDHRPKCLAIAKRLLAPNAVLLDEYVNRAPQDNAVQIVVISLLKEAPEVNRVPIEVSPTSTKSIAGGSRHHGVGGILSSDNIRPRLQKSPVQKQEASHTEVDGILSDDRQS